MFEVRRITDLSPSALDEFVQVSEAEGYFFVRRLAEEWASGVQRFLGHGELLLGAFADDRLVGSCGLTVDPFADAPRTRRVRRMYVLPSFRRRGVGRALLRELIRYSACRFDALQLYAESPEAFALYESMGFVRVIDEKVTHRLALGGAST